MSGTWQRTPQRQSGTVLDLVKAKPVMAKRCSASTGWPCGPALTRSARGAEHPLWSGRKNARGAGRTKEWLRQ